MSPEIASPPPGPPEPLAFRAPGELGAQWGPKGADIWTSLNYSAPNGYRELELDIFVPSNRTRPVGCVIWIHGGAWLFGDRKFPPAEWPEGLLFQSIVDAGLAVATIDYRHSREAPFPAQLHDGKAAIRYLREFADTFGIDPNRFGVWGESAGGHLAALVALVGDNDELEGTDGVVGRSSAVSAVVDYYGVGNLATMPPLAGSFPPEWIEELNRASGGTLLDPVAIFLAGSPLPAATVGALASPVTHVTASAPPFLLVHGTSDQVVPYAQSVELHAALEAAGAEAELVPVPGADHVFVGVDPAPLIARAVEFLAAKLTP
jgi:acetyl esterase/lipase